MTGTATRGPRRTGGSQQRHPARRGPLRWLLVAAAVVAVLAAVGVFLGLPTGSRANPGSSTQTSSPAAAQLAVGAPAPDGAFTTLDGRQMTVAQLRGRPTLLWFVATWCSSCQAGTQVLAQNINQLRARGVRVVEVMLYQNLGQPGPPIGDVAKLAGSAAGNDWLFGTASQQLTTNYDPRAYLDIYYLLDRNGTIRYINGAPASTLPDLIAQTKGLN